MAERDVEKAWQPLLEDKSKENASSSRRVFIWISVNVLATVAIVRTLIGSYLMSFIRGIFMSRKLTQFTYARSGEVLKSSHIQVYVNKFIFEDPAFKRCPSSFVAYHFAITGAMLYVASRPQVALFTAAPASAISVLPLAAIMCANVVLVNLSLALSSIVCYQIVRILLTPLTAAINLCFYGSRIPFLATSTLIPACAGVGIVSYYDSLPATAIAIVNTTSATGVIFAFSGLFSSSLYTVWVAQYHKRLKMSSMQLLLNQVPLGVMLLAFASLFTDTFPVWSRVLPKQWLMLLLVSIPSPLLHASQLQGLTY
jgi:solute carrier family 35 protein E3